MTHITIAVDAMGGDRGVECSVPASIAALHQDKTLSIILVGDQDTLNQTCLTLNADISSFDGRLRMQHASEVVGMDESPALALRKKKDSSMRVALNLVQSGEADACISAGNTGALMAIARFVLKTLPCIDRPAIMAALPTMGGNIVHMLDAGANVDSTPAQLFQFAVMGSIAVAAVGGVRQPRVGLLNIGHEEVKGNQLVKETNVLLQESEALNYCGYTESDTMFVDQVDVVVCDGFVGNAALKACEGTARMILNTVKQSLTKNVARMLLAPFAKLALSDVVKKFDPCRYNGALLLGLQGVVIKSHGSASIKGFTHAINTTVRAATNHVPEEIGRRLSDQIPTE